MNADGTMKTSDEIVAVWARNGEVQRSHDTLLHFNAEMHMNGYSVEAPTVRSTLSVAASAPTSF